MCSTEMFMIYKYISIKSLSCKLQTKSNVFEVSLLVSVIPLTAIVVKMVLQTAANLLIHGGPTALKHKQRTRLP